MTVLNDSDKFTSGVTVVVLRIALEFSSHVTNERSFTGSLNVPSATSQWGPIAQNSTSDFPGIFDLAMRTQYTEGSLWSLLLLETMVNLRRSYV